MTSASRNSGRLSARPHAPTIDDERAQPGIHRLNLSVGRDGVLFVPETLRTPARLIVSLHGSGGDAKVQLGQLRAQAEREGALLLIPESRKRTWDRVIDRAFGPDVRYVDAALHFVFDRFAVSQVAIQGFSDGASYALALGLTNGDLFSHVAAFAPGSARPSSHRGKPKIFIIHGVQDDILPIDKCSREIVPWLKGQRYDVTYEEFTGKHEVPQPLADKMMDWLVRP